MEHIFRTLKHALLRYVGLIERVFHSIQKNFSALWISFRLVLQNLMIFQNSVLMSKGKGHYHTGKVY